MVNNKLLFLFFLLTLFSCVKLEKADLVIHNAKIYTVNPDFEIAQAMAIKDGKIIAIGKEHEMKNRFRADRFFDAQTNPIYPGFIDAHAHFLAYGLNAEGVSLKGVSTIEELINKLSVFIENKEEADWVMGYGLSSKIESDEKLFQALSLKFKKHKIYLWFLDGHKMILNDVAVKKVFPQQGLRNGVLYDKEINILLAKIEYSRKQKKQAIRKAQDDCVKHGLTSVADAGISMNDFDLYQYLDKEDQLKIRVYGMLTPSQESINYAYNGIYQGDKVVVRSFKLKADGALGSSTAYLLENYVGKETRGELLITKDSLLALAELCRETGYQLNVHAIGDGAQEMVAQGMGEILERTNDLRWRIEHAQMVAPDNINMFSKYSILPSVQPMHGITDADWAIEKVGSERLKHAYQIKTLLKQNGMIAFGTDFPVEEINPLKTFYAAVVRKTNQGPIDYLEKEKVSRINALKAITYWNAIAQHQDSTIGSLEVGKDADFVILSRDIMTVSEDEILKTEVIRTFLKGISVYK